MFPHISLHNSAPLKLLIFSLILSSSLTKTTSVAAVPGCHGKCLDSNIPYLLGMFVLVSLVIGSTWIVWSKRQKKLEHHRMSLFDRNGGNILKKKLSQRKRSAHLKIYTAREMEIATNNYSDTRSVMQRCKPGKFYRGTFENNREAVVMKLPSPVPQSRIEQFVDEVIFLSEAHGNLVRVLGCCLETSSPLVVYELHGDGNRTLADCCTRGGACAGILRAAVRGLADLRSRNARAAGFLHGNFCGGNVLLDDSFDAKLFYAAASGKLVADRDRVGFDDKDMYSFGAVLDELLSTRRRAPESDGDLATWLLSEDSEVVYVKEVAAMAARCKSVLPEERPTLSELEATLSRLIGNL